MIKPLLLSLGFLCSSSLLAGNLTIVIDDVGYRTEDFQVLAMPKAISVAIIPDAPFAKARHDQAINQGRDVLIHLPMEANGQKNIEKHHIHVGINQQEIDNLLHFAQSQLPNAIGLNNHMGSKATADEQTMSKLMVALKQHQLHFLDSRTTHKSVAMEMARQVGVKALGRHIFLDNENSLQAVQTQWNKAIDYARKQGNAIVIGHPRPFTLEVIKKGLNTLPADIHLLSLRQLWQQLPMPISQPKVPRPLKFNTLFYGKNVAYFSLPQSIH